MTIPYVVFDLGTGEALRAGQCQEEVFEAQAGEGERVLQTTALTVEGNRQIIWRAAKDARDAHIDGGAMTPSGAVDSDSEARSNISGAVIGALVAKQAGASYSITWTLLDNSTATLNADQTIAMGIAVLAHVDACHERARQLRSAIESAANMAELLAIDVTAGWP